MTGTTPLDQSMAEHDDATVFSAECVGLPETIPEAKLVYIDADENLKGLEIQLVDGEQTLGRDTENSACIASKKISRHHARIYPRNLDWVIEDLNSTNGVFVDDERIKEVPLRHGNIVKLGPLRFRFLLLRPPLLGQREPLDLASDSEHTHYGGDPGVIERLAQEEEAKNIPPKPPLYTPPSIVIPEPLAQHSKALVNWRPLLLALAAAVALGGGVALYGYGRQVAVEQQVNSYTANFRRFIDTFESENPHALENELVEIRKLAVHLDETAQQYPVSDCQEDFATNSAACQFRDLQVSVLFLAFERWLEALLADGRIELGERLVDIVTEQVEKSKAKQGVPVFQDFEHELAELLRKPGGLGDKPAEQQLYTIFNNVVVQRIPEQLPTGKSADSAYVPSHRETRELLRLASIVVEFKQFEKEFPDPSASGAYQPDRGRLSNLQDKKRELGEMIRAKNAVLSGTYMYFKQLVKAVDEKDSNLIDRWNANRPKS